MEDKEIRRHTAVILQQHIFQSFHKKGVFGFVKNYFCITLTSIADNIYNALLLNLTDPEIEKNL